MAGTLRPDGAASQGLSIRVHSVPQQRLRRARQEKISAAASRALYLPLCELRVLREGDAMVRPDGPPCVLRTAAGRLPK